MSSNYLLVGIVVLASVSACVAAAPQDSTTAAAPPKGSATQRRVAQKQDEGERVFQQHCFRCHTAPEGFSPRISGTIVRHMRVRASLSQHEEQVLLRFFNP